MTRLDPAFRARAREWAARPPRRSAAEAAARARAAGRRSSTRWPRRLALAALAAGAAAAFVVARPAVPPPDLPPSPRQARSEPAASRQLVVELASGTRLYVVLPSTAAARRSS